MYQTKIDPHFPKTGITITHLGPDDDGCCLPLREPLWLPEAGFCEGGGGRLGPLDDEGFSLFNLE